MKLLVECETSSTNYTEDLEDIYFLKGLYLKFLCFELFLGTRGVLAVV